MEVTSTSYARIADRYEQARGGAERADLLAGAVIPWLPTSGTVLDVGAGTCVIAERLQTPDRAVIGVDLSREMLGQAGARLPGAKAQADAMALPLPDHTVDAVTFVWVLHHVGDLSATLSEVRRVLRPGGRVVAISGVALPTDDDMGPIFERLNDTLRPGQRNRGLTVPEVGADVGFDVVHDGLVRSEWSVSPNDLATAIEDRLFSFVWDLGDDDWRAHVDPALAELRSLPGPDRVRDRAYRNPIWVLERP